MTKFSAYFTLFRLFGVPVRAHFTWVLYVAGLFGWSMYELGFLDAALVTGVVVGVVFGSLLLHEFAHVFAARFLGQKVYRVLIFPFACATEMESRPGGWSEVCIAFAGPACNMALAAIGLVGMHTHWGHQGVLHFVHGLWAAHTLRSFFCSFNLLIAGLNLIPCNPLDGGRIFRALLTMLLRRFRGTSAAEACLTATRFGFRFVTIPASILLVALCIHTRDWMDIVFVCLLPVASYAELAGLEEAEEEARIAERRYRSLSREEIAALLSLCASDGTSGHASGRSNLLEFPASPDGDQPKEGRSQGPAPNFRPDAA